MKIRGFVGIALGLALVGCGQGTTKGGDFSAVRADEEALAQEGIPDFSSPVFTDENLEVPGMPEDLVWYTSQPGIWGSPRAKKGGTITESLSEYPATFRTIGPNSNGSFRSALGAGSGLIQLNPETREWMPQLATHWAFGKDRKTVYFKLNEKARWNDGTPVTSKDYTFMMEMMRSPYIQAPWYNNHYTKRVTDLKTYGDFVISVTANVEKGPDELLLSVNVNPRPRHHYKGEIREDWVDTYQWVYEPTVGPYYMSSFEKGESVTFSKVDDWWGYDLNQQKGAHNFDTIVYKVVTGGRDIIKEHFLSGRLDVLGLLIPNDWAESEDYGPFKKGYIDRWAHYYVPMEGLSGMVLNTQKGILRSQDIRTGLYYAINIQKMIDTTLRGEYTRYHNIGMGHVFAGVEFNDNTIRKPDFDPTKAGEYFAKAGYDSFGSDGIRVNGAGERLKLDLLYTAPHHTERLSVLKEEAKKAGLDLILNLKTEGGFSDALDKKHEAFWITMSTYYTPSYWQYFHSENAKAQTNNFFMVEDGELDRLITAYDEETELIKKGEISKEIERRVHDLALVVPNYVLDYIRGAAWKWVRYPSWLGTKYSGDFMSWRLPMASLGRFAWVDEDIKKEIIQAQATGETLEPRTYRSDRY